MKDKIRLEVMKVFDQEANVDTVVDNILRLFNVSVTKRNVCPQCKRDFNHTEVPSGIFCCYACEYGY